MQVDKVKKTALLTWRFFIDAVWGSKAYKPELMDSITKLQAHRDFASVLSYAFMLSEDIIFHKDGSMQSVFEYLPKDVDSSTGYMLDANAKAIQLALNELSDGWMVQWDLVSEEDSKYYDPIRFDNIVAAVIDDARRFNFEKGGTVYRSRYFLSFTYKPTDMVAKSISRWFRDDSGHKQDSPLEKEVATFNNKIGTFFSQYAKITTANTDSDPDDPENILSHVNRLSGDKLVSFLKFCITGDKKPLRQPSCGYMLDYYLSTEDFIPGLTPRIGKKYVKTLHIDDLPEETWPAVLDELNYMGCEYRWSSRYIALSPSSAKKELNKIKRNWSSQALGAVGVVKAAMGLQVQLDEAAEAKKYQTQAAITENDSGLVRYGYYTSVVVLMHEDISQLELMAENISNIISSEGFKVRDESVNTTEAYLGSIPGHGGYNIRKPIVDTVYLSHATPTSGVWSGNKTFPHPRMPGNQPALIYAKTRDNRVFRFSNCVSDVMHTMVLGPTGSGKSTLIALMGMSWMKYPNISIKVFDKDNSNAAWVKAAGGEVMDLAQTAYAPLSELMKHEENSDDFNIELGWITQWINQIFELSGISVDSKAKKYIREEVVSKFRSHKSTDSGLSIDDLDFQVPELRDAWIEYKDSTNGLLSGTEDTFSSNRKLCMAMDKILDMSEEIMISTLRFIFHRMEKDFKLAMFTLLILEEFWQYLYHPIFLKELKNWLKTLRKFNVSVMPVTQNVEDVAGIPGLASELIQSCPNIIYLPNEYLGNPKVRDIYLQFGLNEQQLDILQTAIPKRQYYITSSQGNRLIDFDLSPLELAFIGVSGEAYKEFEKIYKKDDPKWILNYLEEKRLFDWKDYVEKAYFSSETEA